LSFDTMPDLGPLLMPGAAEYAARCIQLARAAAPAHRVAWDIGYGPHAMQALDVWAQAEPQAGTLPVVIFWHGGALRHGHKEWIGAMAPAICAMPALLVAPNHRLVPEVRAVHALADACDAVAWVHRNAAAHGGDPERIFLAGHSSGGMLATLAAMSQPALTERGVPQGAIGAAFSIGGMFTMRRTEILPEDVVRTRFRDQMVASDEEAEAVTAFAFADANKVPVHLAWGEHDVPVLIPENQRFAAVAQDRGWLLGAQQIAGADHFGAHLACAEPGSDWVAALRSALQT
jgi:acetyl esterase/lipase